SCRSLQGRYAIDVSVETTSNVRSKSGENMASHQGLGCIAVRTVNSSLTCHRGAAVHRQWQTAGRASTGGHIKSSSLRLTFAATGTGWPGNQQQACARAARGAEAAAD